MAWGSPKRNTISKISESYGLLKNIAINNMCYPCFCFLQIIVTIKITKKHIAIPGPRRWKRFWSGSGNMDCISFACSVERSTLYWLLAKNNHKNMLSVPLDDSLTTGEHGRSICCPTYNVLYCYRQMQAKEFILGDFLRLTRWAIINLCGATVSVNTYFMNPQQGQQCFVCHRAPRAIRHLYLMNFLEKK